MVLTRFISWGLLGENSVSTTAAEPLRMDQKTGIDSVQAWRIAIASSAVVAVSFGTIYTFGAFFDAMADEFDSGLGPTSIVFGITAFLFFGTGAASGFLADRWGARPLVLVGGAMFALGLFLTSRVDALWQGYLTYGIGAGLGGGLFVSPVFAMIAGWFDRQRGIAQGVVATGSGVGTLILLPLTERLIESNGWRDTYVVLAVISGVTFLIGGLLIERPPVERVVAPSAHLRQVMATASFRRFALCGALQSGSMLSAFAFIVPFSTDRGVSSATAALLVGIVGASSIVGRLGLTSLSSRIGPVRILQIAFLVQPVAFLIWLVAGGNVAALVLFVVVLGVAYGGYVALTPLVAAHLFGVKGLGSVMGWAFLAGGLGSLFFPPMVGFIADAVDGQSWSVITIMMISAAGAFLMLGLDPDPVELSERSGDPVRSSR